MMFWRLFFLVCFWKTWAGRQQLKLFSALVFILMAWATVIMIPLLKHCGLKWLEWNGMTPPSPSPPPLSPSLCHSVFKSTPQFIQEPSLHYVPNWASWVQLVASIQRLWNWLSSLKLHQPRVIREGWKNAAFKSLSSQCLQPALTMSTNCSFGCRLIYTLFLQLQHFQKKIFRSLSFKSEYSWGPTGVSKAMLSLLLALHVLL